MLKNKEAIIVIGGSVGGLEALKVLISKLPAGFPAAIFVVIHIGAHSSNLPWLLGQVGVLPVAHPQDGDSIESGHIYVAPPDYHLYIEPDYVHLVKGPRINWTRPAIDPLFQSAAESYGPNVIGVLLSGGLNDGTAGLYEIKKQGGIAIVQDPKDAIDASMPGSALANVSINYCLAAKEIPGLLIDLVSSKQTFGKSGALHPGSINPKEPQMNNGTPFDRPVTVTCPECGGAIRKEELGSITQYGCHIGHTYTGEVMMAAQFLAMEHSIESAIRSLNERAELCQQMIEKIVQDDTAYKAQWQAAKQEAIDQALLLRQTLEREWIRPDKNFSVVPLT